jgi:hypothetical protein
VLTFWVIHGLSVDASEAIYFIARSISLCCTPGILSITDSKMAHRFQCRVSDTLIDYDDLQSRLQYKMASGLFRGATPWADALSRAARLAATQHPR